MIIQTQLLNQGFLPVIEQKLRCTESDKLQVQIQAYLDNIFDVGALLEETETKNAILEHIEDLQEEVGQVGELTKQILWTMHILS